MCITANAANLSETRIYAGEARDPVGEVVHVLGYQNTAENLDTSGGNMMILPLPAAREVRPDDVRVATGLDATVLEAMALRVERVTRSLGTKDYNSLDYVFDVGSYTVVLSPTPEGVKAAMTKVPLPRQPKRLGFDVASFYSKHYRGHTLALCFWDRAIAAEPIFFTYHPTTPTLLFAPCLDAHGEAPRPGKVKTDHTLLWGTTLRKLQPKKWVQPAPIVFDPVLRGLIGQYVGAPLPAVLQNGDCFFSVSEFDAMSRPSRFNIPCHQRKAPWDQTYTEIGFF